VARGRGVDLDEGVAEGVAEGFAKGGRPCSARHAQGVASQNAAEQDNNAAGMHLISRLLQRIDGESAQ